jgi:hypothetical protein
MQVNPEHLRRHYDSLSDEELRAIRRTDLTDIARQIYDAEVERRGFSLTRAKATRASQDRSVEAPEPDWLDEAAEAYSVFDHPGKEAAANVAHARGVLEAAGIPCHVEFSDAPEEKSTTPPPSHLWRLLVPGNLSLQAASTLERDIFNQEFEAGWRAHLEALSDSELLAATPETVYCGLYDRIERAVAAYEEEIARRGLG